MYKDYFRTVYDGVVFIVFNFISLSVFLLQSELLKLYF